MLKYACLLLVLVCVSTHVAADAVLNKRLNACLEGVALLDEEFGLKLGEHWQAAERASLYHTARSAPETVLAEVLVRCQKAKMALAAVTEDEESTAYNLSVTRILDAEMDEVRAVVAGAHDPAAVVEVAAVQAEAEAEAGGAASSEGLSFCLSREKAALHKQASLRTQVEDQQETLTAYEHRLSLFEDARALNVADDGMSCTAALRSWAASMASWGDEGAHMVWTECAGCLPSSLFLLLNAVVSILSVTLASWGYERLFRSAETLSLDVRCFRMRILAERQILGYQRWKCAAVMLTIVVPLVLAIPLCSMFVAWVSDKYFKVEGIVGGVSGLLFGSDSDRLTGVLIIVTTVACLLGICKVLGLCWHVLEREGTELWCSSLQSKVIRMEAARTILEEMPVVDDRSYEWAKYLEEQMKPADQPQYLEQHTKPAAQPQLMPTAAAEGGGRDDASSRNSAATDGTAAPAVSTTAADTVLPRQQQQQQPAAKEQQASQGKRQQQKAAGRRQGRGRHAATDEGVHAGPSPPQDGGGAAAIVTKSASDAAQPEALQPGQEEHDSE